MRGRYSRLWWSARNRPVRTSVVLAAALSAFAVSTASAGDLDRGFGAKGRVITRFGAESVALNGLAADRQGRLVAVGSNAGSDRSVVALARYTAVGSLDESFGAAGKLTESGSEHRTAADVIVQPDGKPVVAGAEGPPGDTRFALTRYAVDGRRDRGFGSGGSVTTDFPAGDAAASVLVRERSGRLVAAGRWFLGPRNTSQHSEFALARYNPDGSLDLTFGTAGRVTTSFGPDFAFANAAAEQRGRKLLVAGTYASRDGGRARGVLARYNADGSLDKLFGSGGRIRIPRSSTAESVVVEPRGRIVVGGGSSDGEALMLSRFLPSGSPDPSFGRRGRVIERFGDYRLYPIRAAAVALQPDGKILAGGYQLGMGRGHATAFAVARFTRTGKLDRSFGAARGVISTSFTSRGIEVVRDLVVQRRGKLVAGGAVTPPTGDAFGLARFHLDR